MIAGPKGYDLRVDLRIGAVLKRLREARGLTQGDVAKLRGVGQRRVSETERTNITVDSIEAYLDAIEATPQEFVAALAREHGSVYLGETVPPSMVAEPGMQDLADRLSGAIVRVLQEAGEAKKGS